MSDDFNTDGEENLNEVEKKTIRFAVDANFAFEVLSKIKAPVPDTAEIDEIHLVIKR